VESGDKRDPLLAGTGGCGTTREVERVIHSSTHRSGRREHASSWLSEKRSYT
jgi:hypothetical protein